MRPIVILGGFSFDLDRIAAELSDDTVVLVDEHGFRGGEPRTARVRAAIYVFSWITGSSSQLLSNFAWVHDHHKPEQELLVALGDVDLQRSAFYFLRGLPAVRESEIAAIVKREQRP